MPGIQVVSRRLIVSVSSGANTTGKEGRRQGQMTYKESDIEPVALVKV